MPLVSLDVVYAVVEAPRLAEFVYKAILNVSDVKSCIALDLFFKTRTHSCSYSHFKISSYYCYVANHASVNSTLVHQRSVTGFMRHDKLS